MTSCVGSPGPAGIRLPVLYPVHHPALRPGDSGSILRVHEERGGAATAGSARRARGLVLHEGLFGA